MTLLDPEDKHFHLFKSRPQLKSGSSILRVPLVKLELYTTFNMALAMTILRLLKKKLTNLTRVARFFFVQHTKTGKNIPNCHIIYQMVV
jgi:hypothetical protein